MLGNNNILYASPKGEIPENFDVVSGNESPKFLSLRECNINHFDAVCFPSAVGSMEHLSNDETLQKLLFSCKAQQSMFILLETCWNTIIHIIIFN